MNVVFIITDTVRIDDLACYGNEAIDTPHLDRLAAESTRFARHYTEGLPTAPSRLAYCTGRFTLTERSWGPLGPDDVLLQEILWQEGYLTAFASDVYHLFKPRMGYGRGFGHVAAVRGRELDLWVHEGDVTDAVERHYLEPLDGQTLNHWYERDTLAQYLRNRIPFDAVDGWQSPDDHFAMQVVDGSIAWLDKCFRQGIKDKLYLLVDIFAPHAPLDAPAPYEHMYTDPTTTCKDVILPRVGPIAGYCIDEQLDHIRRLRMGFVSYTDYCVGRLLDWMRDHGMFENTLIVYVSDHGDFYGEHGILMKCRPWPHDILSHAPLMIRHPDAGHGAVADTFTQSSDLMPTILDALGLTAPDTVQGLSLSPALRDPGARLRDSAIAGYRNKSQSIRDDEWSYYRWINSDHEKSEPELYRLRDDPAESNDLIAEQPDVTARLDGQLSDVLSGL